MPRVTFRDPFQRTSPPPAVVAIIPARYASTRLPGKPLADIGGRPMIEYVYSRAAEARSVDAVVVATDDERIVDAVERFGGVARMTRADHRTGTDRLAEIAQALPCSIVVNLQGDLPLIEPALIDAVVGALTADADAQMATICRPITDPAEYRNPNVVKVVRDQRGHALYFSRSPLPFFRDGGAESRLRAAGAFKHIGLYSYRRDFLLTFAELAPTPLEQAEMLEQLRALEHGFRIRVVETRYESIEVDTPDDLERVRRAMAAPARA